VDGRKTISQPDVPHDLFSFSFVRHFDDQPNLLLQFLNYHQAESIERLSIDNSRHPLGNRKFYDVTRVNDLGDLLEI